MDVVNYALSKKLTGSFKCMVINITDDGGTYSADKSFDEISEFVINGGSIYALYQSMLIPLVGGYYDILGFCSFIRRGITEIGCISLSIDINNNINVKNDVYYTLPKINGGDENKFLKGDGTWSELPLSFNDAGELEVTLNGVTKTFVPK